MTYVLVQCNADKPQDAAAHKTTVNVAMTGSDVVTFNEANSPSVLSVIRAHPDWGHYIPPGDASENAIVWRNSKFTLVRSENQLLMIGGRRGAGKVARDRRRRGPSRYANAVLLVDPQGKHVWHVGVHLIAKAQTTARWRMPLWSLSVVALRLFVAKLHKETPSVPIIVTGDLNYRNVVNLGAGWIQPATPGTYGRNRYDRLFHLGPVKVTNIHTRKTRSDHRALVATVTL